jgi:hypothetical protein
MIEIVGSLLVLIVLTVLIIVFYPQLSNLSKPLIKHPPPSPPQPIIPPSGCMLPPPGTAPYTQEITPQISPGCTLPTTTTPTPQFNTTPTTTTPTNTTANTPSTKDINTINNAITAATTTATTTGTTTASTAAATTAGTAAAGNVSGTTDTKLEPNYPSDRPLLSNTGGNIAQYDVTSSTGKIPNPIKTTYEMTQERLKNLQNNEPEVFNVSTNKFTYYDSEALCHSMGAELATIEQVYDAYKNGGEWCNMGWTKGMMALYPTQKQTWEKLQNGPSEDRGKCGLPGLNGGTRDPSEKFGVNCYGPKPTTPYLTQMIYNSGAYMPKSPAEIERDKRAAQFKKQVGNLALMPFNYDYWAQNY